MRAARCLLVLSTACLMSPSGALSKSRVSFGMALSLASLFRRRCASRASAGNTRSYLSKSSFDISVKGCSASGRAYSKIAPCLRKSWSREPIPDVHAARVVAKCPTMMTPALALVMATLRRFASSVKPTLPVAFALT